MTATRKIYGESKDNKEIVVCSMSDELIDGPTFFSFDLGRALAAGALCDYKILSIGFHHNQAEDIYATAEKDQALATFDFDRVQKIKTGDIQADNAKLQAILKSHRLRNMAKLIGAYSALRG